ncbi:MAG TPA: transketolase C-terminal domain-containing protein, partial [Acidimicrobiia bacterium]|nr:transketolase C-terminal domain-containing protein [Acidimicrobiia bacterium]
PDHLVPIGAARIARPGRDVTVVGWSRIVHDCLAAADRLAAEGIDVEVIDLRTISPWDRTTVLESVTRTGRLLIVQEAVTDFGAGAEIAAVVADEAFWALDAPVRRVGAPFLPAPYAPNLEHRWLPDTERIAGEIRRLVRT